MEDDMTDKATMRRSRSQQRRPADQLALSTQANKVELGEDDLKKVAGGFIPGLWGEGKTVKIDF
jgi:hypothetical protein